MKKSISAKRTHFENRIKSNFGKVKSEGWQSITGGKTKPNEAKRTHVNPNFGLPPKSPEPPEAAAPAADESNPVKPSQTESGQTQPGQTDLPGAQPPVATLCHMTVYTGGLL